MSPTALPRERMPAAASVFYGKATAGVVPMAKIEIKCKGSKNRKLSELKVLQGDLKSLSPGNCKKLRERIEKFGFDAPLFVWKDYILDGTQRKVVLEKMLSNGWELPNGGEVPVVEIQAKDVRDAKARLLGYVSQFGKITDTGLTEFLSDMQNVDSIFFGLMDLPDFDMDTFIEGFMDEFGPDDNEARLDEVEQMDGVLVKCPECGHEFKA